jgi:heme/copper-type cytochrome/quinol oxidase subunit 2
LNFFGLILSTAFGYNILNSPTIFDWYFILMIISSAVFWYVIGWLIGFIIDAVERRK